MFETQVFFVSVKQIEKVFGGCSHQKVSDHFTKVILMWVVIIRATSRLRISEFTQNFWVFSFYIADFWQTFWVIWENGSNWSNLRLKMSFFALGRLKNHKVPHLHPNSTMFMPLDRLQLKIYAFSGKFNVCSKRVLLSWIKICRDFTLQTQIFTQKYRSWLIFYSEFLRKKLAAEGSEPALKLHEDVCIVQCLRMLCKLSKMGVFLFHNFADVCPVPTTWQRVSKCLSNGRLCPSYM